MAPKLDQYQWDAVSWFLRNQRTILGDERGVGKSYPAIVAAEMSEVRGQRLIVCPAYLMPNWMSYLEEFGITNYAAVMGTPRQKRTALLSGAEWMLCSYAIIALKQYSSTVRSIPWTHVIYDEAHRLRGRNSESTKTAYALSKEAEYSWFLTGNPVVSNPGDIYPLLHMCDSRFSSYWRFVREWCVVVDTLWGEQVKGLLPGKKEAFEDMCAPYLLRRRLKDVMPEIPPVIETMITVEMPPRWQSAHKQAKKEYIMHHPLEGDFDITSGGALVNSLRQLTAQSQEKTQALLEILSDLPDGEPVVVFCWYRETARMVSEALYKQKYSVSLVTGDSGPAARRMIVDGFKNGTTQVLVATIGALREGENLQRSNTVVFVEEDWVDANNDQAVGRLQRRGQERTVFKYVICAKDTIDTTVHRIAAKRGELSIGSILHDLFAEEA
jgi:SNF2 family DNA or RNA helicase